MSRQASLLTSPATTTRLVVTRVSQATRALRSSASMASSTASEIWSATLSGCPSETDSEVNMYLDIVYSQAPSVIPLTPEGYVLADGISQVLAHLSSSVQGQAFVGDFLCLFRANGANDLLDLWDETRA